MYNYHLFIQNDRQAELLKKIGDSEHHYQEIKASNFQTIQKRKGKWSPITKSEFSTLSSGSLISPPKSASTTILSIVPERKTNSTEQSKNKCTSIMSRKVQESKGRYIEIQALIWYHSKMSLPIALETALRCFAVRKNSNTKKVQIKKTLLRVYQI